jgi:hypothetical protein
MKIFFLALATLFSLSALSPAAYWSSGDYHCEINLPDGAPRTDRFWVAVGSTEEGTIVGSRRIDGRGYIFLGYVDLRKNPKLHLNEKTIPDLEKRFIPAAEGFHHTVQRIVMNQIPGYRITGTRLLYGNHFTMVMDMYEANKLIYQVVGMLQGTDDPMRDGDIRSCMNSFKLKN